MPPTFAMQVVRGAFDANVGVVGEVRRPQAAKLCALLVALQLRGVSTIVVDLNGVSFLDTAARDALVAQAKELEQAGATVYVIGLHGLPRRLLAPERIGHGGRHRPRLGGAVGPRAWVRR
jgi:ABC-type transporter Mla MlaB component